MKKLQYKWDDGDEWVDYDPKSEVYDIDDFQVGIEYRLRYRVIETNETGDSE